jgi:hypothetical protein
VPKLILGSLNNVQIGFRQPLRQSPVDTTTIGTPDGPLIVPTLDELIGMKAYLAYSRQATRDFLDFSALSTCADDEFVLAALLKSDDRYGELQSDSVCLEIAKTLADPQPFDLDSIDLAAYKGVQAPWNEWTNVASVCRRLGQLLIQALINGQAN